MKTMNGLLRIVPWCMALLLGVVLAACGGGGGDSSSTNTAPTLTAVVVTPATATMPSGAIQSFVATATFSDGSSKDVTTSASWTTATSTTASVASTTGVTTSLSSGNATISASFSGKTGSAVLTVTTATLVSISITPALATVPVNGVQPFVATATYSDGSTRDVTAYTAWASTAVGTSTVARTTGVVTGVSGGTNQITGSFLGKTSSTAVTVIAASLTSIAVTPTTATLPLGQTQALVAKGSYSDGSVIDITSSVSWTSNAPLVAAVQANTGMVTGVSGGSAVITATLGAKSAIATVTVPNVALLAIVVTPTVGTVAIGSTQGFVATATYSDGTTANISATVAWTSGTPSVATVVSNTGMASGLSAGSSMLTAALNGKTGSATLTVTAAVSNGPAAVNLGSAGNFVILAKSGISTTGATAIVGDLGVSPVAASFVTGFGLIADASNTFATSSLVTGKIYAANYTPPTPANMTTAIGDMQTAFTDAAGRTLPDFTELYAGDVTGKVLAPGLYKWGTGLLVGSSGVVLNGGANAVWIFQVAQDLTVSNGAAITLIGGAQAKNVFWQVSGKATLGTTAAFKGVLMSQTLISVGTGASVSGRLMAQTAVTLDAARISAP